VRNNVILDSVDMASGEPRGMGIGLENIKSAVVENNILARCLGNGCVSMDANVAGVTYTNNVVYQWRGQHPQDDAAMFSNPTVTLADYAATLGMNLDQFYAALRAQSQFDWREELTAKSINAFFRKSFAR
jgi:hypothetical protein